MPTANRCIDAHLAVQAAVAIDPWNKEASKLLADSARDGFTIIVPVHFWIQVESIFQFRSSLPAQEGGITVEKIDHSVTWLRQVVIADGDTILIPAARELARAHKRPHLYETIYLATALKHGCQLWTADLEFFESLAGTIPQVKFVSRYGS
jgi:predicted nucleic acid-binding protein